MAKSRARKLADIIVGAGIDIDGNLTFDGGSTSADLTFADNDKANFGDASDLQIYHDGSASYIKEAGTGDFIIQGSNTLRLQGSSSQELANFGTGGAVTLFHNNSAKLATTSSGATITGTLVADGLTMGDNELIQLGTGNDLRIYHDGSHSRILENGTGNLIIQGTNLDLADTATGETFLRAVSNDSVEIYYDGSKKFETTSSGVTVTGGLVATSTSQFTDINIPDNNAARFGDSQEFQIYHTGSGNSIISETGSGSLYLDATNIYLRKSTASGETMGAFVADGAATLYYDNSAKLATFSGGVSVTGQLNATTMHLPDGSTGLQLGASNDTKFFHDGSNSKITHSGSGGFYIGADTLGLQTGAHNENYLTAAANGAVSLYYDNSKKFETTSTGIQVTGNIDFPSSATILGGGTNTNMTIGTSSSGYQGLLKLQSTGDIQLFQYGTSWTTNVTFKGDGQVGIGTTSPQSFVESSRFVVGSGTSGTNEMMFLYSGTNAFGAIGFADGTSGTERYRGIIGYHHDGDEMFFSTNGGGEADRDVTITSAGNVGIGTASPSAEVPLTAYYSATSQFHVGGAQAGISNNVYYNGSAYTNRNTSVGGALLQIATDGSFAFRRATSGSSPTLNYSMYIDSLGKVGIGTTSPGKQLTINGADAEFLINRTGSYADTINMGMPSGVPTIVGGTDLAFGGTGTWTEHMRIKADGNIGIGTSSPTHKLHVAGTGKFDGALTVVVSSGGGAALSINHSGNENWSFDARSGSGSTDYVDFGIAGSTRAMTWQEDGNVGIGTSSPANKLQIGSMGSSGYGGNNFAIGDGTRVFSTYINSTSDAVEFYTNKKYAFLKSGSGATGNVGIGRADPSYGLDVKAAGSSLARFVSSSGDALVRIIADNYTTESDARLFLGEADAYGITMEYDGVANIGYIGMNDNVDPTGSYSKRIQFPRSTTHTSFMAGNVGIGTDSPANKLEVKASGNDNGIMLRSTTNVDLIWLHQQTTTEGVLRIYGSGSAKVIIPGHNSPTYFNNGNNFGIGTTSPNHLLTVAGTIAQYNSYNDAGKFLGNKLVTDSGSQSFTHPYLDMRRWTGSAANHYVASIELAPTNADAGSIVFYSDTKSSNTKATTERMRITDAGKVFIGISSASDAQFRVNQTTSDQWAANFINHQNVAYGLSIDTSGSANTGAYNFAAYTPSGTGVFITNTAKVGIGQSSPTSTLDLTNTSDTAERAIRIENSSARVYIGVEGSSGNRFVGSSTNNAFIGTTTSDGLELATANTVRATIDTSGVISTPNTEFLGFEDAINILNADPEDGGSDFDQTPTNNSDGGQTFWEISNNGDAIYFSSTSGGHGGTWMKVYCDAGLWALKGSVRLTNTDGAVHGSTSSANYKFTHSFRFYISSGPDTGHLKWDADAAASNTGTDFTRATFSTAPISMSAGYKTINYETNGYNGVQRIYITDLQLVKVG